MRDGVHARRDRQSSRKGESEIDVVNDEFGKDLERALCRLPSKIGLTQYWRRFRTGIRRRDDDLRKIGSQRDRLAEPGGRTTAERDGAVGLPLSHNSECFLRNGDRR